MQIILTEQEYNTLKQIKELETIKIKDELFDRNLIFLKELVEYCKLNYSPYSYESGNFGKDMEKLIEKHNKYKL